MLNRLDNIAADASGTTQYAQYSYLGLGTVVKVAHPAVSGGLTLSYGTPANEITPASPTSPSTASPSGASPNGSSACANAGRISCGTVCSLCSL